MENTVTVMESTTSLAVEDVLASLLGDGKADDLAALEIDHSQMPAAKGTVWWSVAAHC